MNTLEELPINELFERLRLVNGRLSIGINLEADDEIMPNITEASKLSEIISKKQRKIRESWFIQTSYLFCCATEQENYEFANGIMKDLKYFRHCFLEDSNIAKDLSNKTLRIISLYEDKD